MPYPPWSRIDYTGLARFVTPDAWLRLDLSRFDIEHRLDAEDGAEGRRLIVGAIYAALQTQAIHYAWERYDSRAAYEDQQTIRTPSEIFGSGEGTCLDLAVLFCGLCLRNELLPILIVLKNHALAAVSLKHGLREWNSYDRQELPCFEQQALTDPGKLCRLIDEGRYIAVECTGFAKSDALESSDQLYPEVKGRVSGVMSLERAVAAGREQLSNPQRPLAFAIDPAVAHYKWGITPFEAGTPQIRLIVDTFKQESGGLHRFLYRTQAIPFLGRDKEIAELAQFLADHRPFRWLLMTGPAGVGKSRLALELCLRSRHDWRAGFVPRDFQLQSFTAWIPNQPTLLVMDYAASRAEDVGAIARMLTLRGRELPFPVRMLLLERESKGQWVQQLMGAGSDGQIMESTKYNALSSTGTQIRVKGNEYDAMPRLDALELDGLADEELYQAITRVGTSRKSLHAPEGETRSEILAQLRDVDPSGRPLFAALFADALNAGRTTREWDVPVLIQDVLAREETTYWKIAGITEPDKDLLALATLSRGIDLTRDDLPQYVTDMLKPELFSPERYRSMCGRPAEEFLSPLEPDIVGEIFALKHFGRRHARDSRSEQAREAAWSINPEGMIEFLTHAAQDFPKHPTLWALGDCPVEKSLEIRLMWLLAANYLLPACVEAGMIQKADFWAAQLWGLYNDVRQRAQNSSATPSLREQQAMAAANLIRTYLRAQQTQTAHTLYEDLAALVQAFPNELPLRRHLGFATFDFIASIILRIAPDFREVNEENAVAVTERFIDQLKEGLAVVELMYDKLRDWASIFHLEASLSDSQSLAAYLLATVYSVAKQTNGVEQMYKDLCEINARFADGIIFRKRHATVARILVSCAVKSEQIELAERAFDELRDAVARFPRETSIRNEQVRAAVVLITTYCRLEQIATAKRLYEALRQTAVNYPAEQGLLDQQALAACGLIAASVKSGDVESAEILYDELYALASKFPEKSALREQHARAMVELCSIYKHASQTEPLPIAQLQRLYRGVCILAQGDSRERLAAAGAAVLLTNAYLGTDRVDILGSLYEQMRGLASQHPDEPILRQAWANVATALVIGNCKAEKFDSAQPPYDDLVNLTTQFPEAEFRFYRAGAARTLISSYYNSDQAEIAQKLYDDLCTWAALFPDEQLM
jgi:hypothetical protein